MMRPVKPIAERFWARVDKRDPSECWPWTGGRIKKGYGQMGRGRAGEGTALVHRVSWEIHNGAIPHGAHVLHRCDNPPCVNPAHLRLGSNQENIDDMVAKGRSTFGLRSASAKLTESDVRAIRVARGSGRGLADLANEFNVSSGTISDIAKRRTWRHIT